MRIARAGRRATGIAAAGPDVLSPYGFHHKTCTTRGNERGLLNAGFRQFKAEYYGRSPSRALKPSPVLVVSIPQSNGEEQTYCALARDRLAEYAAELDELESELTGGDDCAGKATRGRGRGIGEDGDFQRRDYQIEIL